MGRGFALFTNWKFGSAHILAKAFEHSLQVDLSPGNTPGLRVL
jgi:hypothetical protein